MSNNNNTMSSAATSSSTHTLLKDAITQLDAERALHTSNLLYHRLLALFGKPHSDTSLQVIQLLLANRMLAFKPTSRQHNDIVPTLCVHLQDARYTLPDRLALVVTMMHALGMM